MAYVGSPLAVAAFEGVAAGGAHILKSRTMATVRGRHTVKGRATVTGGWLADDFFRLCHHDATGRRLLHPRVAGIGLAAALLGELAFAAKIAVEHGAVRVVDRTPPADALAHKLLDQVTGEAQVLSVRTWLAFLGGSAYDEVAARMTRARQVRPEESRWLLRRTVTYVPTDINEAGWPCARLSERLRRGEPLDHGDMFLAGLMTATDLHLSVLDGAPRTAWEYLAQVNASAWLGTRELVHHTRAAVGDGVLSAH